MANSTFAGVLDWQFKGFRASKDAIDVNGRPTECVDRVDTIRYQSTARDKAAETVHGRQSVLSRKCDHLLAIDFSDGARQNNQPSGAAARWDRIFISP
jgi:hypothetical protein